ncbi:MAG TPA: hypothetical protein DIC64_04690 [Alphaproteobacteria bacterium]|nr:hypothetical protein [Alphaproteobacteria bacterium]
MKKIVRCLVGLFIFMAIIQNEYKASAYHTNTQSYQRQKNANVKILNLDDVMLALANTDGQTSEMVEKIMKEVGANARNSDGKTILMIAVAKSQNLNVVDAIIKNGISIDARDKDGSTALMEAARHNQNPEIISLLINHGADVNARNEEGLTPLLIAAQYNKNADVIETLIKYGANIESRDKDGKTVLISGIRNPKVVEVLLKNGADVEARDKYGWTPLIHCLTSDSNIEVAELLLKYGANIETTSKLGIGGLVRLSFLSAFRGLDNEIGKEYSVWTPLIFASVFSSKPEIVELLINNGADTKIKDIDGKTALDYAKENPDIYQTNAYWLLNDKMYQ